MAFTSTIDQRPSTMGNLLMVFGTFTNTSSSTGGDIDLSSLLNEIVASGANAGVAGATDTEVDATAAATLTLVTAANIDGKWWAMGRRG